MGPHPHPSGHGAQLIPVWHPSPNHGARRDGLIPRLIVVHYTEMHSAKAALERLCDPAAEVSAHYLVGRCGTLWQLVAEDRRAWHAGAGSWRGMDDINSRSIGIEIDNDGMSPFAARAMTTLEHLLGELRERWDIPVTGVIAHSDMAPGRKIDPGARFDWRRLALGGHAIWPEAPGDPGVDLATSLERIGYPPVDAALRLAAFRLRFRPGATGPETASDRALAHAVAEVSDLSNRSEK